MYKYAIIVAGGSGSRFGGTVPKQFQLLNGKPVIWHTMKAFIDAFEDIQLILVLPKDHLDKEQSIVKDFPGHRIRTVTGGETRFHSVKNGLNLVDTHSIVFIHDAVRCLVSPTLIKRCAEAAIKDGNAIPAVSAPDTLRIETETGYKLLDRNKVKLIQTPQTFTSSIIKQAFEQEYHESFTDEATVVEKTGVEINLVEGEASNIKITTPVDLYIAEKILEGNTVRR